MVCQESKPTTYCGPLKMMAVEGKGGSVQGGSGSRRERGEGRNCLDSDKGVPEDERPGNLGFFSSPTREGEAGRSHLGRQEAARRNHRCKSSRFQASLRWTPAKSSGMTLLRQLLPIPVFPGAARNNHFWATS